MQSWVEKFLFFARDFRDKPFEHVLLRFEHMLEEKQGIEEWQRKQAKNGGGQVLKLESYSLPRFNNVANQRVVQIRIFGNFSYGALRKSERLHGLRHGKTSRDHHQV